MPSFFRSSRRRAASADGSPAVPQPTTPTSGPPPASGAAPGPVGSEATTALLDHLRDRRVAAVRTDGSWWTGADTIDDDAELADAVAAGVTGWLDLGGRRATTSGATTSGATTSGAASGRADRAGIRLTVGPGTHLATAATATLAMLEDLAAAGVPAVPTTGGPGTLWVLLSTVGTAAAADEVARSAVHRLVTDRPESVTTDTAQAQGRAGAMIFDGRDGRWAPVPYSPTVPAAPGAIGAGAPSLAPDDPDLSWDGSAAVIPLHPDEIAAIAAGMPLTVGAADLPARLRTRGDLAAVLR
ncbi:hypothetical protein [Nakamurella leprariae]|uniref:Uncharacterized protein n=1 Tax=Nakamurella leprariae TaxID=2803911 RepID=A0A938Y9Y7_9ACTN|nr:hypothetical protein [Nakamurella leprariae]MBM9465778.1 hypothetical protein [Nakamurella leprariae]